MQWNVAEGETICFIMELSTSSSSQVQQRGVAPDRSEGEGIRKKQKTEKDDQIQNTDKDDCEVRYDKGEGMERDKGPDVDRDNHACGPTSASTETRGEGLWPGLNPGSATVVFDDSQVSG